MLASHAAIAIETAQLIGALRRNQDELAQQNAHLWREKEYCRETGRGAPNHSLAGRLGGEAVTAGAGSAAIQRTILPNNRRVRWLSARSSQ